jgi:hypothetical protein
MQLTDIRITPENWERYDSAERNTLEWDKALDVFTDINRWLDANMTSSRMDWAGRYVSFLDGLGIEANSENGWYSLAAALIGMMQ